MNESYQKTHEQFVSGHNGGSVLEISVLAATAPLGALLNGLIQHQLSSKHMLLQHVLDFSLIILPFLLVTTILSNHITAFVTTMFLASLTLLIFLLKSSSPINHQQWFDSQLFSSSRHSFITTFRSYLNVATAISILAVDFSVYPRRMAKTETYGTGLMDVGVGAFVVANAIVSSEARKITCRAGSPGSASKRIIHSIFSTWPLLVLGLGRLVTVKGTNYHEHVSEYGVHWNFFFTLAAVRILSSTVLSLISSCHSWLISITLSLLYQFSLSNSSPLRLGEYILHGSDGLGSRDSILDANREGLISCFGYVAIYFSGVQLGAYIARQRSSVYDQIKACAVLVVIDSLLWFLLTAVIAYIEPVSRRMVNLPFIIWMMAYCIQQIASFLLVDILLSYVRTSSLQFMDHNKEMSHNKNISHTPTKLDHISPLEYSNIETLGHRTLKQNLPSVLSPESTINDGLESSTAACSSGFVNISPLVEAINRNALLYFLLANVLTGCVNFSMHTVHVDTYTAVSVLVLYLITLNAIILLLHIYNITIKFW